MPTQTFELVNLDDATLERSTSECASSATPREITNPIARTAFEALAVQAIPAEVNGAETIPITMPHGTMDSD